MATSRRQRKCIDSSSAGRAGIFYCSSWRTVCWLPVPPPAGREDTQQDEEGSALPKTCNFDSVEQSDSDEDVCCRVTAGPPAPE